MSMGALADIRVVDFGRYIAGPWCGQLLAGLGADVVRVERPGGAEDRALFPLGPDVTGAYLAHCNRAKRSVTVSPGRPGGRSVVEALVRWADVVVANVPDQTLVALGIDWATVHALNPRCVLATASSFGSDGPYGDRLGFDGVAQAMCGADDLSGRPGDPMKTFAPWVDVLTATTLTVGVLAALRERDRTGVAHHVAADLLASALVAMGHVLVEEAATGIGRTATGNRHTAMGPSDIVATADGWVQVQVGGTPQFARWCAVVDRPDLAVDPRFTSDTGRGRHGEELSAAMAQWCSSRSTAEVLDAMAGAAIPCAPVLSPRQVLADPHVAATLLAPVQVPGLTAVVPAVRMPLRVDGDRLDLGERVAELGADTDGLLGELGFDEAARAALRATGTI